MCMSVSGRQGSRGCVLAMLNGCNLPITWSPPTTVASGCRHCEAVLVAVSCSVGVSRSNFDFSSSSSSPPDWCCASSWAAVALWAVLMRHRMHVDFWMSPHTVRLQQSHSCCCCAVAGRGCVGSCMAGCALLLPHGWRTVRRGHCLCPHSQRPCLMTGCTDGWGAAAFW